MGLSDRDYMQTKIGFGVESDKIDGSKLSETKFDSVSGELSLDDSSIKNKNKFNSTPSFSLYRFDWLSVGASFLFVVISFLWIIELLK